MYPGGKNLCAEPIQYWHAFGRYCGVYWKVFACIWHLMAYIEFWFSTWVSSPIRIGMYFGRYRHVLYEKNKQPTSRTILPTFQTFCPVGLHFAQTVVHFAHFQVQARTTGVIGWGWGVSCTYISQKGCVTAE